MDTTKVEKLQAMKRYGRRHHFIRILIQYLTAIILLGLFLSSPLWLSTIFSSLKFFYFVSLPNLRAIVFGPKFLFIVCNLIVVFLIGESKLSKSSLTHDIYEEYMSRNTNLQRFSTSESKKGSVFEKAFTEGGGKGEEEKGTGREEEDGYEDLDELNRRVEEFIARVNKQRRLEQEYCDVMGEASGIEQF